MGRLRSVARMRAPAKHDRERAGQHAGAGGGLKDIVRLDRGLPHAARSRACCSKMSGTGKRS